MLSSHNLTSGKLNWEGSLVVIITSSELWFFRSLALGKFPGYRPNLFKQRNLVSQSTVLFTSSFTRLPVSCPLPSPPLTGHGVLQILPPLPKRGVSHHVDNAASQAAQDVVHSREGAAGAGQRVPHVSVVEARGLCSREPRTAWASRGQGYKKEKNRTELTFINYKMPGTLLCTLHALFHLLFYKNPWSTSLISIYKWRHQGPELFEQFTHDQE